MKGIGRTLKRRRFESKTDYSARIRILQSEKPRIVVRRTNRYIVVQLVESTLAQDKVLVSVSSRDLVSHGWPAALSGSLKSLPAAYLTGLLLAQKMKGKATDVIFDIGMQRNASGGRLYAVLAGLIEGGISIPHNASVLPSAARLEASVGTREAFIKLKEALGHGGNRNKK